MKIHEYQAKDILRRYGVPVPDGRLAESADQAFDVANELGGGRLVVKAQVHAGGRGKAGGIKLVEGADAARQAASSIIGMRLKTHQDPEGREVRKVYIEKAAVIKQELYLGVVLDRAAGCLCLIASTEGGVEIEEVAARDRRARLDNPDAEAKIQRVHVPDRLGWSEYIGRKMASRLGLGGKTGIEFAVLSGRLLSLFRDEDASMVEINPLVLLDDGSLMALDAKIGIEDNALFRHEEHLSLRDVNEENPLEAQAAEAKLNYIALDGEIGCMVNGAGLAMATMDIIKLKGGEPANFLDVGGGADAKSVAKAFRIIQRDPNVRAVLVNIFGGIVKCDLVAQGIIEAMKQVELTVPLVVRLQGTNALEAKRLLDASGLSLQTAEHLDEAAKLVVAASRGGVD